MPVRSDRLASGRDFPGAILDKLSRKFEEPLARYFRRRVDNPCDVPDLVQEVLARLARLDDLSAIRRPENYIFRTASSVFKDRIRRGHVRRAKDHHELAVDLEDDTAFAPDRVLEGRQALEALKKALRDLPERTRDVFVLRAFEGRTTSDVGRALAISTRAVEAHHAKALAFIARAIRAYREG